MTGFTHNPQSSGYVVLAANTRKTLTQVLADNGITVDGDNPLRMVYIQYLTSPVVTSVGGGLVHFGHAGFNKTTGIGVLAILGASGDTKYSADLTANRSTLDSLEVEASQNDETVLITIYQI